MSRGEPEGPPEGFKGRIFGKQRSKKRRNNGKVAEWLRALHPAKAGQVANFSEDRVRVRGRVKCIEGMAYVYILQDMTSGKYYIGSCLELSTRVARHQRHTGGRTIRSGDWRLLYYQVWPGIEEARRQEKLVKSYKGGNAFKKILSGDVNNGKVAEWLKAPHC